MINIAFVLYRNWAYEIFNNIIKFQTERNCFSVNTLITTRQKEFRFIQNGKTDFFEVSGNDTTKIHQILSKHHIEIAFFYGWSWIVKKPILDNFPCLCLHPSPLPRYRGGTPIQHQILNNEQKSAVTVFKMNQGIDDGDIYKQLPMSLSGNIDNIFRRMTDLGTTITKDFIADFDNNEAVFTPQKNLSNYPPLKRRVPEQSEIFLNSLHALTFQEFNNLTRALTPPFPSVFIQIESKKFTILGVQKYIRPQGNYIVLNEGKISTVPKNKKIMVKLKDSYAHITNYDFNS